MHIQVEVNRIELLLNDITKYVFSSCSVLLKTMHDMENNMIESMMGLTRNSQARFQIF